MQIYDIIFSSPPAKNKNACFGKLKASFSKIKRRFNLLKRRKNFYVLNTLLYIAISICLREINI